MATIKRFEDLEVWKQARLLCKEISKAAYQGSMKDFDLGRHIRRTAGSIMDNIAEGYERDGKKEFIQFLSIAKGSVGELKSQLYRCRDTNCLAGDEFEKLYTQTDLVGKQLGGFIKYLKSTSYSGNKFQEPEVDYVTGLDNQKLEIRNE